MIKVELKNFKLKDNDNKFCEKCCKEYCSTRDSYYEKIVSENKQYKIYTCPYGYSSILTSNGLYTGLVIKNHSNFEKIKRREKINKNYKMNYSVFMENDIIELFKSIDSNKLTYDIYKSTVHDIKRASSCTMEIISSINLDLKDIEIKNIVDGFELINTRLDYHDRLLLSPKVLSPILSIIKPCSIGKKISKLLEYKALPKNIKIVSHGVPYQSVINDSKSVYVLFFVLIENAIKYSPINSKINITYQDKPNNSSYVEIINECTELTQEDIDHIFEKGYRGKNSMSVSGNGLGMEVVKKISDICKIEYGVELIEKYGKKYFKISFMIPSIE